jgi:hypothetical protein
MFQGKHCVGIQFISCGRVIAPAGVIVGREFEAETSGVYIAFFLVACTFPFVVVRLKHM